jgi:hypothetical protein
VAAKCVINDQLVSANGPSAILSILIRFRRAVEDSVSSQMHIGVE